MIYSNMKLETAKRIFKDRAENFYGKTVAWLADQMANGFDENQKITAAYNILKKEMF